MLIYFVFYVRIVNVTKNSFCLNRRAFTMRKTLRNRPLDSSLILINQEDYKIYGDVVITGQLIVINSKVTIKGKLEIVENVNLKNQIFISGSKIHATSITSEVDIVAHNSSINTMFCLSCMGISGNADVTSAWNINVRNNAEVGVVRAKSYTVGGSNNSENILCLDSVFISEDNNSKAILAKNLHVGGDSDFGGTSISVECFTSNGHVKNCYGNLGCD